MMNRNNTYLQHSQRIAESLIFLEQAKSEKEALEKIVKAYVAIINTNLGVFSKFPLLTGELKSGFTIGQFNTHTANAKIDQLNNMLIKLAYMHDLLQDMEQIKDPVLQQKVSLQVYKPKFINAASNLLSRSVDTLYFEMQQFAQLFKKANDQMGSEKQKRERVRSLMGQDLPLLVQFPVIETEFKKIVEGEVVGSIGADYVINNYKSIRDNLHKIGEFNTYFSRLSKDYLLILGGCDLQIFQTVQKAISLNILSGEFLKLNAKATEYKQKMIKLDTLRNLATGLYKEINEKISQLSSNHQTYVQDEMAKVKELLVEKPGPIFEQAEPKINTIREVLKKEFRSNDQRATDALYIRQSIAKYENQIWQEDLTLLFEELNNFVEGKSTWNKDEFGTAMQKFIRQKNEMVEVVKSEFELYFSKNRDYKNKFEKITNTKSLRKDLENLVGEMGSFKPLKNIFYKFIK